MRDMLCLVVLAFTSVSATRIFYRSLSDYPLAVCNNGQAASLYFQGPSETATQYLIGLQAGGECHTIEGCTTRCEDNTSPDFRDCGPFTRPQHNIEGMYSSNSTINPTFHTYHKTFIPYCSSDFHSGNKTASSETGGYHFRGKEIFRAAIEYLKVHTNVENAATIVFNGGSAGGFGVLANCDYLRTLLPNALDIRCVVDAAGYVPLTLGEGCPADDDGIFFDYIPGFWGGIPNELCAASTNPISHRNCYDLRHVQKYLQSPMFIINTVFDSIYMPRVCNDKLTGDTANYFKLWGGYVRREAENFQRKYTDWGLFIPSCYQHGLYKRDQWFAQLPVGDEQITMAQALDNWMTNSGEYVVWDTCVDSWAVPCNEHCRFPPGLPVFP